MTQPGLYRHPKSGDRYFVLGAAVDSTNGQLNGRPMTVYLKIGDRTLVGAIVAICCFLRFVLSRTVGSLYVRATDEFDQPGRFKLEQPLEPDRHTSAIAEITSASPEDTGPITEDIRRIEGAVPTQ